MDASGVLPVSRVSKFPVQELNASPQGKALADLNELIGQAIKESCPAGMAVRRDPMPVIAGSNLQLQQAFRLLVQAIVACPPAGSRHFLYFKHQKATTGELGQNQRSPSNTIAIFTNIDSQVLSTPELENNLQTAQALFEANGLFVTQQAGLHDDCIYLLTIAGKPEN